MRIVHALEVTLGLIIIVGCGLSGGTSSPETEAAINAGVVATVEVLQAASVPSQTAPVPDIEAIVAAAAMVQEALQDFSSPGGVLRKSDDEASGDSTIESAIEEAFREAFLQGLMEGLSPVESGKQTVFAGLEAARGSVELKGSVIANGDPDSQSVTRLC